MLHFRLLKCINVFAQKSVRLEQNQNRAEATENPATADAEPGKLEKAKQPEQSSKRRAKTLETSKSEAPSVQKSEWPELIASQRSIIINLFSPSKNVRTK